MPVIAEHVEARARRREQYCVARLRGAMCRGHRLLHVARAFDRHTCTLEGVLDAIGVTSYQDDGPRVPRYGGPEATVSTT